MLKNQLDRCTKCPIVNSCADQFFFHGLVFNYSMRGNRTETVGAKAPYCVGQGDDLFVGLLSIKSIKSAKLAFERLVFGMFEMFDSRVLV
jgi:hypothetical protein